MIKNLTELDKFFNEYRSMKIALNKIKRCARIKLRSNYVGYIHILELAEKGLGEKKK